MGSFWWGCTSWFTDDHLLSVSSHGGGGEGALWGFLHKGPNPIHYLIISPKALPPNTITLGVRFQHMNFERYINSPCVLVASVVAQMVKNLPAMQETRVQSLGWEDPLEKEMATHSSILAWEIPWTEEPGRIYRNQAPLVGLWSFICGHMNVGGYINIYRNPKFVVARKKYGWTGNPICGWHLNWG